ncbi:MAG TPA: class I SAM-dependent rRNA methyltransferase, partial [bacterium]|nr:class I SAM-dependent rRNA methyltransferase [bacterium]
MKRKNEYPTVTLKPGRERSIRRRHPWVFSGAIARVEGAPEPGDTVLLTSSSGEALALGAFSPSSQIRVRIWTFDPAGEIDSSFFDDRVRAAAARRNISGGWSVSTAGRIVFSEADGVPGLVADGYGDVVVAQFLSAGAEKFKKEIAESLCTVTGCGSVYERSDAESRELEGLAPSNGVMRGAAPPGEIEIIENGLKYFVDVRKGHKTGFYLDQAINRSVVREISAGVKALNCFCYTGAFSVAALAGGAESVVSIDSSEKALETARRNAVLNGFEADAVGCVCADAFEALRGFVAEKRQFDLVILDPPKLAADKGSLERAGRAYKDANMHAMRLLPAGGTLVTFSCSGLVSAEEFQKIAAWAALDAGVTARIVARLSQAPDHPV